MYGNLVFSTDTIPIIDADGKRLDEVHLKEAIRPVPRRRCGISASGLYCKGAGIVYTGHYANERSEKVRLVYETGHVYEKYNVVYPHLYRQFGIFLFRHQPVFSDCEGGCGKKERNLLALQSRFRYTAIEDIVDVLEIPIDGHAIYQYKLKELNGSYRDTLRLIEYLLCENYNTAWDKNVWDDIACFGYVRDLADWFVSDRFEHKLGTMYALLNSLIKKDKYTYEQVVRDLTGLEQFGDHHIISIAAAIVKRFSPGCVPDIDLSVPSEPLYTRLWEALYSGKACCHLEDDEAWDHVRDTLKANIPQNAALAMKDYFYHRVMMRRVASVRRDDPPKEGAEN